MFNKNKKRKHEFSELKQFLLKLDVGCGNNPKGDINCDLFKEDVGHRTGEISVFEPSIEEVKIPNFVQCDASYLPFKNDVFDVVYCCGVIEHVADPFLCLKELVRVSNDKIIITCPHRYGDGLFKKNIFHINKFNKKWFFEASKKLHCYNRVKYIQFVSLPFSFFTLFKIPLNMKIVLKKFKK